MVKRPILCFSNEKPTPQRVFDVVVEGNKIDLEIKSDKKKIIKIPWNEVVSQVEAAKAASN
jgi:hypothetical protein